MVMASIQYSSGARLGPKTIFRLLCILQSGNAERFSNLFTPQPNSRQTFSKISIGRKKENSLNYGTKSKEGKWRLWGCDDGSCGIAPQRSKVPSVLDLILDFYNAINLKDTNKIDQLLTDDCLFQDLIFYFPFSGKQSILNFLHEVMDAMGPNIYFYIDSLTEGENFTASVKWHMEWKDLQIPFTTGFQFFECEECDGKLFIRKISGVEEFPVKPGDFVLELLKAASSIFDSFPVAAIALLEKSHESHGGLIKFIDMLGGYKKHSP